MTRGPSVERQMGFLVQIKSKSCHSCGSRSPDLSLRKQGTIYTSNPLDSRFLGNDEKENSLLFTTSPSNGNAIE